LIGRFIGVGDPISPLLEEEGDDEESCGAWGMREMKNVGETPTFFDRLRRFLR